MLARVLHHVSLHRFFNLFCRDIFFLEILFITRLQECCGLILNLGSEDYLEKKKISFSIRIKPSLYSSSTSSVTTRFAYNAVCKKQLLLPILVILLLFKFFLVSLEFFFLQAITFYY